MRQPNKLELEWVFCPIQQVRVTHKCKNCMCHNSVYYIAILWSKRESPWNAGFERALLSPIRSQIGSWKMFNDMDTLLMCIMYQHVGQYLIPWCVPPRVTTTLSTCCLIHIIVEHHPV